MLIGIPENLAVDEIIQNNPPVEIKNFDKDILLYFLSLIYEVPARNKDLSIINGFVCLKSTYLQKRHHDYRHYFKYAIRTEIIQSDNHFIEGQKSMGFKFSDSFSKRVKIIQINNRTLIRNIRHLSDYDRNMSIKYKNLFKHFNYHLEIDEELALDYIRKEFDYLMAHPEARKTKICKKTGKLRTVDPFEQYNSSFINIHRIANHDFILSVDPNVGRFHSNFTNFKSELRNFITFSGQQLFSIDIKNSQPYSSTILFKPSFYKGFDKQKNRKNFRVAEFSPISIDFKGIIKVLYNNQSLILLDNIFPIVTLVNLIDNNEYQDVTKYIDLVVRGELYDYLAHEFEVRLGREFKERKELKAIVFQVLFTHNSFIGQKEAAPKRLFKELFPTVYKIFSLIKLHDSTLLPRMLQRIESTLILDIICKRISKARPNCPIFTIHDSIATTQNNVSFVNQIMIEELTKHIGYPPVLKIEPWSLDNLKSEFFHISPLSSKTVA